VPPFSTVGGNLHEHQAGALKYRSGVPFLPVLRQPTLILAGDDDPMIPLANARLMHALIRGSRLHVYSAGTSAWSPRPPSWRRWWTASSPRRRQGQVARHAPPAPVADAFLWPAAVACILAWRTSTVLLTP